MMPAAPARFSTMNCCLSESVSGAENRRESVSFEPPGGNGETNLTGLAGHSWASTGREKQRRSRSLKAHIPAPLELQHLARLVGRGDLEPQLLEDAADL